MIRIRKRNRQRITKHRRRFSKVDAVRVTIRIGFFGSHVNVTDQVYALSQPHPGRSNASPLTCGTRASTIAPRARSRASGCRQVQRPVKRSQILPVQRTAQTAGDHRRTQSRWPKGSWIVRMARAMCPTRHPEQARHGVEDRVSPAEARHGSG